MTTVRERFARDGYAVLDERLDLALLHALRAAAERVVDGFDLDRHRTVFRTDDEDRGRDEAFLRSASRVHCFLEPDAVDDRGDLRVERRVAINKLGHALHDLVPEFGAFCRLPVFGRVLRAVGLTDPLLWQTMYVFKPPRIGGQVRWHQDATYLITRPSTVVGIWVAVDDADRDNGCLWIQPGGHRSPLREVYEVDWSRRAGILRVVDETPWPTLAEARPLELPAGSVVVFHARLPHCSQANVSDRSRHALTLHAAERVATWAPENWLQREGLEPFGL